MESSHRNENEHESPDLEKEKPVDSTSSDLEKQNPPSEELTEAEEEQQELSNNLAVGLLVDKHRRCPHPAFGYLLPT
jgi:hypothetical protein